MSPPSGIPDPLKKRPIDLLILCRSLTKIECAVVTMLVQELWPLAKTVSMLLSEPENTLDLVSRMRHQPVSPAMFLGAVNILLWQRQQSIRVSLDPRRVN